MKINFSVSLAGVNPSCYDLAFDFVKLVALDATARRIKKAIDFEKLEAIRGFRDIETISEDEMIKAIGKRGADAYKHYNAIGKAIKALPVTMSDFSKELSDGDKMMVLLNAHRTSKDVMPSVSKDITRQVLEMVIGYYNGHVTVSDARMIMRALLNRMVSHNNAIWQDIRFHKSDISETDIRFFLASFIERPRIRKDGGYSYKIKQGGKNVNGLIADLFAVHLGTADRSDMMLFGDSVEKSKAEKPEKPLFSMTNGCKPVIFGDVSRSPYLISIQDNRSRVRCDNVVAKIEADLRKCGIF